MPSVDNLFFFGTLFFCLNLSAVAAVGVAEDKNNDDEYVVLSTMIIQASPADALNFDPIVPAIRHKTAPDNSSGSIQQNLMQNLPVPILDHGQPGTQSSVLGLGRSSEETDVEAFGIPLNPPQGGGFDLSNFPQYMISEYQFNLGPTLGAFDPKGAAGSLRLTTWPDAALAAALDGANKVRLTQFYSNAGVSQVSVSGAAGDRAAAVIGYSDGLTRGPGLALSGRWSGGKYHLVASRLDAASPGSKSFQTPNARQLSTRVIPIFQADIPIKEGLLLKSSVFFDGANIRYDNPGVNGSGAYFSRDQVRQAGVENALLWRRDWRFGLSARRIAYESTGFIAPSETMVHMQGSRLIPLGSFLLEPTLQANIVSRFGIMPAGSFGIKRALWDSHDDTAFARVSYSRRIPSLMSRYYVVPGFFSGNPDLKPEHNWTVLLGLEATRRRTFEGSLQAYAQYRQDSQISIGVPTPYNAGAAWVGAVIGSLTARPTSWSWFEATQTLSLTASRVIGIGEPFPYLPSLTGLTNFKITPWPILTVDACLRFSSASSTGQAGSSSPRTPGYGYVDLGLKSRVFDFDGSGPTLDISGRVENLFDRPIEFIQDYPTQGRIISVAFVGEF